MNIHEYQAKELLSNYGVRVPIGKVAFTAEEAKQIATHIVNGDFNVAKDMFERRITGLKHFEAAALRDQIHAEVEAKGVKAFGLLLPVRS